MLLPKNAPGPWAAYGISAEECAARMQQAADREGSPKRFVFNNIQMHAYPGIPVSEVVDAYYAEANRLGRLQRRSDQVLLQRRQANSGGDPTSG